MYGHTIAKHFILSLHIIFFVHFDAFHIAGLSMTCFCTILQITCFIVGVVVVMIMVIVVVKVIATSGVILKMRVVQQAGASSVQNFEFIDRFS